MPLIDLADDTFVAADVRDVAPRFRDARVISGWLTGLQLHASEDRGIEGVRWTVTGAATGTGEVWLERVLDGVVVHFYLRADPVLPLMPLGLFRRFLRPRRAPSLASRLARRYTLLWKRQVNALKDELESGREPGMPRVLARSSDSTLGWEKASERSEPMSLTDKRVLILAADHFEDSELLYPLYRLREEEADVVVAGLNDKPVHGKKGHGPLAVDTTVDTVKAGDFDAIVVPGGYQPDILRRSATVLDLIRSFDSAGKPIAMICHAGWVGISAGVVEGRRATAFSAIKDDMVNAGAKFVDEPVVVDGNLITSRHPGDLGPWMKALVAALSVPAS